MILRGLLYLSLAGAPQLPADTVPANAPPAVVDTLRTAKRSLDFLGYCTDTHPTANATYDFAQAAQAYRNAFDEAVAIWGPAMVPGLQANDTAPRPECSRAKVNSTLVSIYRALASEATSFAEATRSMTAGAWVGTLRLCRPQVVSARVSVDPGLDTPRLDIELAPAKRPILARLTSDSIGRSLPIRVDGVVVSRPVINAAIADGALYLVGPDKAALERLAAATVKPC
ncbi:MAG: hypothetical protein V4475_18385 [Pseudomonadota bacterium]